MQAYVRAYKNKEVIYKYRGRTYNFSLSQGLFSSAEIDRGSHFLLKVFSTYIDECINNNKALPGRILDAGSGIGVLGICAIGAVCDAMAGNDNCRPGSPMLRMQDRDELARIFSFYNAQKNKIPKDIFSAHTEPLLSCQDKSSFDIILSNIPAKAGLPVLEDFVQRSLSLLSENGRVYIVVVNPLADFFESRLQAGKKKHPDTSIADNNDCSSAVVLCEKGPGHTVFVYTRDKGKPGQTLPSLTRVSFFTDCPAYIRGKYQFMIEKICYNMETAHGASGFDNPGSDTLAAAKLINRLKEKIFIKNKTLDILVWSEDQGHFSTWISVFFNAAYAKNDLRFVLSGRNILALIMAKHNIASNSHLNSLNPDSTQTISAADIFFDKERLLEKCRNTGFSIIAYFPEPVPGTEVPWAKRIEKDWESFEYLLEPDGIVIIATTSSQAESFDRKKTSGFTRLGDIKQKGFRACAYRKKQQDNAL